MQSRYSISTETNGSRPFSYPPAARHNGFSNNGFVEEDDSFGRGRQLGNRPMTSYATKSTNGSNYELDDDATYHLDHLATFTVSPNRGLSTPNDAIARLRHMAQTSGIWTKRLRLRVGARDLVVVEGNEPIERFPLRLITDAVCETTPVESYNNVVVVTVAGDDKMGLRRRIPASEMHLFHCLHKPGQGLVDDILTAKAGKPLRKHAPVTVSQSAPVQPIYSHPTKRTSAVDNSSPTTAKSSLEHKLSAEEKRTIDLKVLDLCFGEIERFVAHLQNAAREQKLKETGLSSDVIRAPPAKEFFDIFQKVKLSFILLARLKHEIRDPNASELVHALFTPFKLIIDASRDAVTNQAQLASQIVAPLLTTDAVELLNNCLSSQESELLGLLGTAWTTPRNQWKDNIPQFHPHFAEGYTPPVAWINDVLFDPVTDTSPDWLQSSQNSAFTGISAETPDSLDYEYPGVQREQSRPEDIKNKLARDYTRRQELEWKRAQQRDRILSQDASRGSSSADVASIDDRQQQEFLRELRNRNANICLVTKRREAGNSQELTVEANEIVEVTDESRNWWKVMNCQRDVGFVPSNILQKFN